MWEKEILRNQKRRLGIIHHAEEITKNIAKTCRYFRIGRAAFYRWLGERSSRGTLLKNIT